MNRFLRLPVFSAFALIALLLVSCSNKENDQPVDNAGSIVGAGATFPQPLYQRWIDEFTKINSDKKFTYDSVGSGEGIKRFIAHKVDFGASDAAMRDDEIAKIDGGVNLLPMTAGMIVISYNIPGLSGELKLPRDVYVDIFMNRIKFWDDPRIKAANPQLELPHRNIQVVVRRDGSGTTFAFTNHLGTVSNEWKTGPGVGKLIDWPGNAMTASGNAGVAQKIKITANSIGYIEYGFAKRLGLPMAALENKSGEFVLPSAQSGQMALARNMPRIEDSLRIFLPDPIGPSVYPIVTYTWLLTYKYYDNKETAQAIRDWVSWALDDGQVIAENMGYIPLPTAMRHRAKSAVDLIN